MSVKFSEFHTDKDNWKNYVDRNSNTYHQREMEQRIRRFESECEMAINHIGNLKEQARGFLDQLSGEPRELKARFLQCTNQLDEFMYHITEFNLMACNLDVQGSPQDVFLHRKADGSQRLGLPPQPKLDPASVSKATVINVSGAQLWLVVDDDLLTNLVSEMTEHYINQEINQDYIPEILTICAYYDEADTKCFLRALYLNSEDDPEVFLVDTGEFQPAVQSRLRPLHPRFCSTPPLAHLCCLADVEQTEDNNLEDRQNEFLNQFLGERFKIKLKMDDAEDNPSKPVAVYLFLEDGTTVNEVLVQALASSEPESVINKIPSTPDENQNISISQPLESQHNVTVQDGEERVDEIDSIQVLEKSIDIDDELDYSNCPEYENALEAVTGYNNRDEMDICKHYTGGEGCFKGHRCKKRHVKMHPNGWTLDRVSVTVKCRPAFLPAPGTCHKVKVTQVDSTCLLYVHFERPEEPLSLANLVDEMTRAAPNSKSLQLDPAPGELLSARFSDGRYYRARVIMADERETEVMFIDYGNTATVPNTDLRPLESRWLALPVQAVPCRLAGVSGVSGTVSDVSAAEVLNQLALDKTMEAHIIARDYDELSVKLVDSDGFDIAEQLAAFTGIELKPYTVEDDSQRRCHHVPA